jgi:hypothetical protein
MDTSKRKAAIATAITVPVAAATALWLAAPASAAQPASAARVNDHIQLMTTSATSSTLSAIETGAFTGAGVDYSGSTVDTLVFPAGTYKAWHGTGTGTQTLNPRTCLLTVSLHGTDRAYDGTGKFRGISGRGTWQASVLAIYPRSGGKCATGKVPLAFQEIITGSGVTRF